MQNKIANCKHCSSKSIYMTCSYCMQYKLDQIHSTMTQVDKIKAIILGEYFNRGGWSAADPECSGLTGKITTLAANNTGLANTISRLQSSGCIGSANPIPLTSAAEADIDRLANNFNNLLI